MYPCLFKTSIPHFRRNVVGEHMLLRRIISPSMAHSAAHVRLGGGARTLCQADVRTRRNNAFVLLGLEPGASVPQIRKAYFKLAKMTHPDMLAQQAREAAAAADVAALQMKVTSFSAGSAILDADHKSAAAKPTVVPFLEVQAAYELLMQEDGDGGSPAQQQNRQRPGQKAAQRQRTLGEVLCDRLRDEPELVTELWEDIQRLHLRVTNPMLDAIFHALKENTKAAGNGAAVVVDAARFAQARLIRDGSHKGLLDIDTRCSAFVTLLNWCHEREEELGDLAFEIIDEINDEDRAHSPAVMSAIGSVFCSGTRSPY
jgi:hypothetical protein